MRVNFIEVVLVFAECELVTLLVATIVVGLLLHCVICQVDKLVGEVVVDESA